MNKKCPKCGKNSYCGYLVIGNGYSNLWDYFYNALDDYKSRTKVMLLQRIKCNEHFYSSKILRDFR